MRIGTANFYQRNLSSLQLRQSALDRAQEVVSTGKQVLRPSDDPVAANSIIKLKKELEVSERYLNAQNTAERFNQEEETSLESMGNILLRMQELVTQGINGALDRNSLEAIKEELSARFKEFGGIANQKNANGDYMFSGYQTKTVPYTQDRFGYYQYNGDDGVRNVLIAPAFEIAVNDPGSQFIDNIASDYKTFVPAAAAASGAQVSMGLVSDPSEYAEPQGVSGTFQIQFSGAPLTYTVVDLGLPNPPAADTIVAGPYDYTAGDDIVFQGIRVKTDANTPPVAGDNFDMQPATVPNEISIFSIFQQTLDALSVAGSQYTAKAVSGSAITVLGGNIANPEQHVLGDFDISFPVAGQIQIDRVDRSTIPATVLENVVPAQTYNATGTSLTFNGTEITVSGPENVGEVVRLDRPETSRRVDMLGEMLKQIESAQINIENVRSSVGARLNSIENEDFAQQRFGENTKKTLAQIEEIDIYQAISDLETSSTGLRAAQQSFAKIQNLTLFEFI